MEAFNLTPVEIKQVTAAYLTPAYKPDQGSGLPGDLEERNLDKITPSGKPALDPKDPSRTNHDIPMQQEL